MNRNTPQPPPMPAPDEDRRTVRIAFAAGLAALVVLAALAWAGRAALERRMPGAEVLGRHPELRRADSAGICAAAFALCSSGQQGEAEGLLDAMLPRRTRSPDLWFFRGVLRRSRFSKQGAEQCFNRLFALDDTSPRARAARLVIAIDQGRRENDNFEALQRLAASNPKDPLILWLVAIECRELARGDDGEAAYRKLATHFGKGPVMFHQTFANVLMDYQKKHEEALQHYRIAVEMEPRSWSQHALGSCLQKLKRYDEAELTIMAAVSNSPSDGKYWNAWARCLERMGRGAEAIAKYEKAVALEPRDGGHWNNWGSLLTSLGRHDEAFEKYQRAAELGETLGMANLSTCYTAGWGCETNHSLALSWAQRAYAGGSAQGCEQMGRIHRFGYGVPKDYAVAMRYFEEGARKGDVDCIRLLGWHYAEGKGVQKDGQRAMQFHERASQLGDPEGTLLLGEQLASGWGGVPRDGRRAVHLLGGLYTSGYERVTAAAYLAFAHAEGNGIPTNHVLAARYYQEALPGGEKWVMDNLARLYENGDGVTQDFARACQLYEQGGYPRSLNAIAWKMATSTNAAYWDGPRAVKLARRALGKNTNDVQILDTLAAAHARAGHFAEAVAIETRVVGLIERNKRPDELAWLDQARARVALYRDEKPCVETAD